MLVALDGERYDLVAASLKKLGSSRTVPSDCALWARIAWAYLQLGRPGEAGRSDHRAASVTRDRCSFVRSHPLSSAVDASLQLNIGRPEAAHATASKIDLPWARVVAAEALLELGDAAKAKTTLVASDAQTPLGFAIRLVLQEAEVMLLKGKPKDLASEISHLEGMADNARSQRGRHTLGATQLALGDLATAKAELRRAITDTTELSPNPRANRTHTMLAEIAFTEGDLDLAAQEVQQAISTHAHDHIALALQARLALRNGDADGALQTLATMRKAGWMPAIAQLVVAEALVVRPAVTAGERDQAKKLVTGLVGHRSIPPPELGRVAALVDPQLAKQLKLPVGKLPGKRA
jgi:predicted negative regulator of RcsB-dependent stress response